MVSETSSAEVYEQIFAGIRDSRDLAQAIARAVRELREAMEKEELERGEPATHVRNLREIDPQALATAYALAEKTCTYWPTPGQIREAERIVGGNPEAGFPCNRNLRTWRSMVQKNGHAEEG